MTKEKWSEICKEMVPNVKALEDTKEKYGMKGMNISFGCDKYVNIAYEENKEMYECTKYLDDNYMAGKTGNQNVVISDGRMNETEFKKFYEEMKEKAEKKRKEGAGIGIILAIAFWKTSSEPDRTFTGKQLGELFDMLFWDGAEE